MITYVGGRPTIMLSMDIMLDSELKYVGTLRKRMPVVYNPFKKMYELDLNEQELHEWASRRFPQLRKQRYHFELNNTI